MMESEHIYVGDIQDNFDRIDEILDNFLFRIDVKGKNALRFSLLTEEAVRLVKSIISDGTDVEVWFEGDSRLANINLRLETKGKLDVNTKEELLSVSTSKENSAQSTFFDYIKNAFTKPDKPTWSLTEYEAGLVMKRSNDKFDVDSWEDLERSVLANMADDITVAVKDNSVTMVITKDFSESLSVIGNTQPTCCTSQIIFNNTDDSVAQAQSKIDEYLQKLDLAKKDFLHVKLMLEEAVGLVKAISGEYNAMIWAERYKNKECAVKLLLLTKMDIDKKMNFLEAASSKKNSAAVGFMGKITDIIQTGVLSYDSVMKLNQEYNGFIVDYGNMGTYVSPADLGISQSIMWSMNDYKKKLKDVDQEVAAKEPWDELERSIVASVAKDVIVGIKDNSVNMTIIVDLKEE